MLIWRFFFRALADRTRLRILNLLGDEEVCVCFFVEILQLNQPNISRHLAYLKQAGIVGARRDGKWMHYKILPLSDPYLASILRDTLARLAQDKEMQQDRKRLLKACCAPTLPVSLQRAPKPVLREAVVNTLFELL